MVVKSARGRRRYIVFTVPEGVGRHDVLDALSPLGMDDLRVITSFDGKAVVRTSPSGIEKVRTAMADSFGSESLLTSGTLRTLRDRCPELRVQNNDPRIKRKKQAPGNNGA